MSKSVKKYTDKDVAKFAGIIKLISTCAELYFNHKAKKIAR